MLALAVLASTPLSAQQTNTNTGGTGDRANAGRTDSVTSGANIRVSQLTGTNIENSQGESVGEINDLVIDANTGKVRYAAITYGGFLGIGDKMFAVPFEAFKVRQDRQDADETVWILDVTQQQLEGAVGFDQDHWPNFADPKFTSQLDKRYGVERRNMRSMNRDGRIDVNVNEDGVDVDVDRNRTPR
jgi:sporulation protein YlmC with PRC-barrel domain